MTAAPGAEQAREGQTFAHRGSRLARVRELRQAAAHGVRAAVRARRRRARVVPRAGHVAIDRLDRARVHLRALRGDGVQSHRRPRDRRAQSAHAPARAAERRAARRRGGRRRGDRVVAVRLRGVAAQSAVRRAVAARARLGVLLQLHEAIHALVAPRARRRDVDRAGGRISRGDRRVEHAVVDARRAGARAWRRGAADSTCSTRCRTSSSIASQRLHSLPVAFGERARAGHRARSARRNGALPRGGRRRDVRRHGSRRFVLRARRRGRRGAARVRALARQVRRLLAARRRVLHDERRHQHRRSSSACWPSGWCTAIRSLVRAARRRRDDDAADRRRDHRRVGRAVRRATARVARRGRSDRCS